MINIWFLVEIIEIQTLILQNILTADCEQNEQEYHCSSTTLLGLPNRLGPVQPYVQDHLARYETSSWRYCSCSNFFWTRHIPQANRTAILWYSYTHLVLRVWKQKHEQLFLSWSIFKQSSSIDIDCRTKWCYTNGYTNKYVSNRAQNHLFLYEKPYYCTFSHFQSHVLPPWITVFFNMAFPTDYSYSATATCLLVTSEHICKDVWYLIET